MHDLEPPRTARFAYDDLGKVVGLGVPDYVLGDAPLHTWKRDRHASERFGEAQGVGDAIALFLEYCRLRWPST